MRLAIAIYLLVILGVAYAHRKSGTSFSGYVLADRSLGKVLSTFGLLGSFVGGGTLLAVVGHVAITGLGDLWYLLSASLSFLVLAWIAPELRGKEVATLPQFVGSCFGVWAKRAILPFSLLAICGFIGVQIGAASLVVAQVTGWGHLPVLIGLISFVTAYTWLGGMKADTVTDGIQFGVVFLGLMLCIGWLLSEVGSIHDVRAATASINDGRYLSLRGTSLLQTIGVALVLPLIMITSPTYHQRIYSTKSSMVARSSGLWSAGIYVLVAISILVIGITGRVVFMSLDSYDGIVPAVIEHGIGGWFGGLILAALLAAVMSSVDTHLISLSTIVCADVMPNKGAANMSSLRARVVVVVGAAIGAILVALAGSLFDLLAGTWVILVGACAGPVILAAKAPWVHRGGVLAGIFLGGLGTLGALILGKQPEALALPAAVISFGIPFLCHGVMKLRRSSA